MPPYHFGTGSSSNTQEDHTYLQILREGYGWILDEMQETGFLGNEL
jgi:hypothetical protein